MFLQVSVCPRGGVHGRGACVACTPPPSRYYEIRSMSGRYASYWNAFLLKSCWPRYGDTVNERAVRILLECILVKVMVTQGFKINSSELVTSHIENHNKLYTRKFRVSNLKGLLETFLLHSRTHIWRCRGVVFVTVFSPLVRRHASSTRVYLFVAFKMRLLRISFSNMVRYPFVLWRFLVCFLVQAVPNCPSWLPDYLAYQSLLPLIRVSSSLI